VKRWIWVLAPIPTAALADAQGRYWYMGSHNGRLGVIE
jgi:hypothetical protein